MKRVLLLLTFLCVAAGASAQQQTRVFADGMTVYGEHGAMSRLGAQDFFFGTPAYDVYKKALNQRIAGGALLVSGAVVAGAGTLSVLLTGFVWAIGEPLHDHDGRIVPRGSYLRDGGGGAALGVLVIGTGMAVGGLVLRSAAKRNVAEAANIYNSTAAMDMDTPATSELLLGFTPGGVGLALRF